MLTKLDLDFLNRSSKVFLNKTLHNPTLLAAEKAYSDERKAESYSAMAAQFKASLNTYFNNDIPF